MGLIYFFVGLGVLLLGLYAVRAFLSADSKKLSGTMRKVGGAAALIIALFLTMRGGLIAAVPLALIGLGLLGWSLPGGFGAIGGGTRSAGQRSRVRTQMLEMLLDHDTGQMDGDVVAGRFKGRKLSSLGMAQLIELWNDCRRQDMQSARLLEAYLDHHAPEWREAAGANKAGENGGGAGRGNSRMSPEEAYEILGLSPGASASDVRSAHRELMKKLHPDRGGPTYLATKINEAKDVLLSAKR